MECLNRAHEPAARQPALLPPGADGRPLPQGVVDMLARMTATDPQERPADARSATYVLRATAQELGLSIPEPRAASSPPHPTATRTSATRVRILEPQLTVLFDEWDKPAVTRPRILPREPARVLGTVPPVPCLFVPPADTLAGAEDRAPAQSAREPAQGAGRFLKLSGRARRKTAGCGGEQFR